MRKIFVFLLLCILLLAFGSSRNIKAQQTSPTLTGTFLYLKGTQQQDIPAILNEIQSLRLDTIIIDRSRNPISTCGSAYQWDPNAEEKIYSILQEAQQRNLNVYVGLSLSKCIDFSNQSYTEQDAQDMKYAVETVLSSERDNPALAGWYIPYEPSLAYIDDPQILQQNYLYYKTVTDMIKSVSSKPIIVSPILAGAYNKSPEIIAQRALDLKTIGGVDIQAWQDSEGTNAIPLDWTRGTGNTYQLRDYVTAISQALGKDSFWSNVELFSCPFPLTYWDIGDCASANWALYKPASVVRIMNQIQHSANAGKIVSWLTPIMMSQVDPLRKAEAGRLFSSFQALRNIQKEYILPVSYQWSTQPQQQYSDAGNELFDKQTGDPRNIANPNWIGIQGNTEVTLDFGEIKKIDWVGIHILTNTTAGIAFPNQLQLLCSTNNSQWTDLGNWNIQVPIENADYVFSNPLELQTVCHYLKIKLTNSSWTFLSEIEITGNSNQVRMGDANSDNVVDTTDYTIWLNNYKSLQSGPQYGDFDTNGKVDGKDYVVWLTHFEQ